MKSNLILALVSAAVAGVALAGCSPHEDSPKTPYFIATTPTYRATVNSTDPVIDPIHMTPGVNGGQVVKTPSVPAPDSYNANSPLALAVYVQLIHSSKLDAHYVTVEGKESAVLVQGTVSSAAQKTEIERIARQTAGVKSVQDDIVVLKS